MKRKIGLSSILALSIILTGQSYALADDVDKSNEIVTSQDGLPESYDESRESEIIEFKPIPRKARRKIVTFDSDLEMKKLEEIEIPRYDGSERKTRTRTIVRRRNFDVPTDITEILPPPIENVYVNDDPVIPTAPAGSSVSISDLNINYDGSIASKAVEVALSKLGIAYAWGANGPDNFDCSGLMQWSYKQAGLNFPRVSWDQIGAGPKVDIDEAKPGDIVGYSGGGHVAMYIGDGKVVHAPQTGDVIKISPIGMMPIESITRVAE